jgi:hypothetical protein
MTRLLAEAETSISMAFLAMCAEKVFKADTPFLQSYFGSARRFAATLAAFTRASTSLEPSFERPAFRFEHVC